MNVKLLCKVIGEAGNRVDLLVFPTGNSVQIQNVRIIRLPNIFRVKHIPVGPSFIKLFYDIIIAFAAFWRMLTVKYDAIHGIEEGGFIGVVLGLIFKKSTVYDMDSCISDQLKYSGFIKNRCILNLIVGLEKWCLGKCTCAITVCHALTQTAKRLNPTAQIYQIEDIPISDLNPNRDNIAKLKNQYNLGRTINVVYTGNLESYQGIDLLIEGWRVFCSEIKDRDKYRLVIIGGTPEKVQLYKQVAFAAGLQEEICWVGHRPSSEMPDWMDLSTILVSPRTEGENTPLKIYTYMASGRPILATRQKTHTQILDDSMAFLADPDPYQFGIAMMHAVQMGEIANSKANKAKQTVKERYSYSVFQRKLLGAYASL